MGVNMNFNTFNDVLNYWAEHSARQAGVSFLSDLDSTRSTNFYDFIDESIHSLVSSQYRIQG